MNLEIQRRLFALQDLPFKEFQSKLIPTVDPKTIIGVRIPSLRALAKEFKRSPEKDLFLSQLPHTYLEENHLHAFFLETIRDYETCIQSVSAFLPFIDNWATCDSLNPRVFASHLPALLKEIRIWISSEKTYTCRFGIGMLLRYYLDEAFSPDYLTWVADIRSSEYYVNMMIAWFFATALAKQFSTTLPFLEENRLDAWTHNKAIQKGIESRRLPLEQKAMLRSLKRKKP